MTIVPVAALGPAVSKVDANGRSESTTTTGVTSLTVKMDADRKHWLADALNRGNLSVILHAFVILLKQSRNSCSFSDTLRAYATVLQELQESDEVVGKTTGDGILKRFLELNGLAQAGL